MGGYICRLVGKGGTARQLGRKYRESFSNAMAVQPCRQCHAAHERKRRETERGKRGMPATRMGHKVVPAIWGRSCSSRQGYMLLQAVVGAGIGVVVGMATARNHGHPWWWQVGKGCLSSHSRHSAKRRDRDDRNDMQQQPASHAMPAAMPYRSLGTAARRGRRVERVH